MRSHRTSLRTMLLATAALASVVQPTAAKAEQPSGKMPRKERREMERAEAKRQRKAAKMNDA